MTNKGPAVPQEGNVSSSERVLGKGFASPARDYAEQGIDLNKELVRNPASTFLGRVGGDAMADAGFEEGDILVIDKSLPARNGDIVVCYTGGEFTLRRVRSDKEGIWLCSDNPRNKRIRIEDEDDFAVWGVVTYSIKDIRKING